MYNFTSNILSLDIGEYTFDIEVSDEFDKTLRRLSLECEERASDSGHENVCGFLLYIIDELLGKGASKYIFAGHAPDTACAAGVISHICDEYGAFRRKQLASVCGRNDK